MNIKRKQFNKQNVFKDYSILFMLAASAVVLVGLQVFLSAHIATTGRDMKDLERSRVTLQAENKELEKELAELSSLTRIERRATEELGMFVAQDNYTYLLKPAGQLAILQ